MIVEYDERAWQWSSFLAGGYAFDWTAEQLRRLEQVRAEVQHGERSEGATAEDRLRFGLWLYEHHRIGEGGPGDPEAVPRPVLVAADPWGDREDNVAFGE